jgi:hypothetical protein
MRGPFSELQQRVEDDEDDDAFPAFLDDEFVEDEVVEDPEMAE